MRGRSFVLVFQAHAEIIELRRRLNHGQGTTFLAVIHDPHLAGGGDRVVSGRGGELLAAD